MTSEQVIEAVAEWYNIEPDEQTGKYDLDDYDWQSGCSHNGHWVCIADVVGCIENMLNMRGLLD